jgi:hypothetical protein
MLADVFEPAFATEVAAGLIRACDSEVSTHTVERSDGIARGLFDSGAVTPEEADAVSPFPGFVR